MRESLVECPLHQVPSAITKADDTPSISQEVRSFACIEASTRWIFHKLKRHERAVGIESVVGKGAHSEKPNFS